MSQIHFDNLRDAITSLNAAGATEIATTAIADGVEPVDLITYGIRTGLDIMGERFSNGDCFLPELMLAGRAADSAVAIIEPAMLAAGNADQKLGKVVIATVKDDLHDIGKNIVALMLRSAGFDVIDLGSDKSKEEIFAAAEENNADIVGLSTLMTTCMSIVPEFVELLKAKGVRDKYKVLVGGAPLNPQFAADAGCDGYAADASKCVEMAKELMGIAA
ncbi:B12-binding domain-containing protein [Desulfoluna sp.]|uniref:cobalamin B12-binding domain-containing protein n=1 Tax=Desulfoluna sp. TaxID=2045199 RepID=UPI002630502B|nr:corrinoid protein [Desulfoluna sp.]